jgi:mRNA interferase RelE/StbE
MKWALKLSRLVIKKDLPRLSRVVRDRIKKNLQAKLLIDPVKKSKPLAGTLKPLRSFRVGSYRVVFMVKQQDLIILLVGVAHRSTIYEELNDRL